MTSPNGVATNTDKTPAELQLEIARTRSAITEDLRVLSERFNPQQLRESARDVMRDAREEATHLIHDAKEAAFGSLIGAKDRAVEKVQARVHALGDQTRHAGVLTLGFLTRNRVMMSLLGVASGLLVYALRGRTQRLPGARRDHGEPAYQFEHYSVPLDEPPMQPRFDAGDASSPFATRRQRAIAAASDNRTTIIAATVLAGVGLGLLLPIGQRPRRALARAGERVWDEARVAAQYGADTARRALGRG
ncbi:MAG TPA: DUF3618 domain-containing protein [Polyangiales bacterium]|nr:DUF3618 domain-containing protein [Polyangiales bacterium]